MEIFICAARNYNTVVCFPWMLSDAAKKKRERGTESDLRIRESSNDSDLKAAIEKSIIKYNDFLSVINEVVEFIPEPKAIELTPPIVS